MPIITSIQFLLEEPLNLTQKKSGIDFLESWAHILPLPFWKVINRARSPKKNSKIPNLIIGNRIYRSDQEKAELFRMALGSTFTEEGPSSDFDSIFYSFVENFVSITHFNDLNVNLEKIYF